MSDPLLRDQVRRARGQFAAMAATYGLGVFNDSFFRQTAMLLAVSMGKSWMQGYVMAVFTLPYILFASPAGWLADRFPKRRVVIASKGLELAAMIFGAIGILCGDWTYIMAMVFTMGTQACLFSPALNGSIPELYPDSFVTQANARLKVVTTAAILGGISVSGVVLSIKHPGWAGLPLGQVLVAGGVVLVSLLGLTTSFFVPRRPAASPGARFPWTGPLDTLRQCAAIDRDRLLAVVAMADVCIWFVGSMLIPILNVLALEQFGRGEDVAGCLIAMEVVGVAVGGVLGSRLATGARWHRVLPAGLLATGVCLLLAGLVPLLPEALTLPAMFALLALVGVAGGIVLVPCEAFVQTRAAGDRKGIVIASVNFAVFVGILISGPVANALNAALAPTLSMAVLGAAAVPTALWLRRALSKATNG